VTAQRGHPTRSDSYVFIVHTAFSKGTNRDTDPAVVVVVAAW
jgi:hypothetical protein